MTTEGFALFDTAIGRCGITWGPRGIEGVQVEPPETNIVFVDLTGAARERGPALLETLQAEGVLATGLYRLRFVTHLDVDEAGIDRAAAAFRRFFSA